MREDGPTLPNLHSYTSGDEGEAGRTPTWPVDRGDGRAAATTNYLMPLMLGASLVLNVVLLAGLASLLIFGHTAVFSPSSTPGGSSSPPATVSILSTASPGIVSPTATSSLITSTGWLQATPTSVQLGCNGNQQTQFVVLKNTGTAPVQWQVSFSLPVNQAGVNVNPNQGMLNSGSDMPIQIQNQTHANGPQGTPGQHGTIEFNPATPGAGPAASIAYSTIGCR